MSIDAGKAEGESLLTALVSGQTDFIQAAASLGSVLDFSDAMILAMVFPNMLGLLLLFPTVRHELKRYLEAIKNHKN